jgi:hypothetical protein
MYSFFQQEAVVPAPNHLHNMHYIYIYIKESIFYNFIPHHVTYIYVYNIYIYIQYVFNIYIRILHNIILRTHTEIHI